MLRNNGRRLDNTFLRLQSLYIYFLFFVQYCVVCAWLVFSLHVCLDGAGA